MENKKHIKVFKRTGFIQDREIVRQRSTTESRRDDTLSIHCAVPAGHFIADTKLLQVFFIIP